MTQNIKTLEELNCEKFALAFVKYATRIVYSDWSQAEFDRDAFERNESQEHAEVTEVLQATIGQTLFVEICLLDRVYSHSASEQYVARVCHFVEHAYNLVDVASEVTSAEFFHIIFATLVDAHAFVVELLACDAKSRDSLRETV